MDGLFIHFILNEIKPLLVGGRIGKIHQPLANELHLVIRNNRKNYRLVLSSDPSFGRIHLTEKNVDNPMTPPPFCQLCRKYLEGGRLLAIKQVGTDRQIHLVISHRNEVGDLEQLRLVVEIMNRHSNIVLLNATNKIISAIKYVDEDVNRFRTVLPNDIYINPPSSNKHEATIYPTAMLDLWGSQQADHMDEPWRFYTNMFEGISKHTALELVELAQNHQHPLFYGLNDYLDQSIQPTVYIKNDRYIVTPFPYLTMRNIPSLSYDTLSKAVDFSVEKQIQKNFIKQSAGDIKQLIQKEINRHQKKLKRLKQQLIDTDAADEYRIKGELLTAYLYQIKPGDQLITLPNFYDNEKPLKITLAPHLSANDNAQKYFKTYQKLKRSIQFINQEMKRSQLEIEYFETLATQLIDADLEVIESIKQELQQQGYLKVKQTAKKVRATKFNPLSFTSPNGHIILVGRNNQENDWLTMKKSNKQAYWFHTKDIPGSHVVLQTDQPSEADLHAGAMLAAYYSKYRDSGNVPVDYTQIKYINKPNGSKPGFVIYTHQKTLYVTPSLTFNELLKD
ncbi:Rqc2 family fibronectin-binding protein [Atopobacter phocae]|uniref:Rqc2 family fibronectin-binding protein n=1 Tax=Atopobacter phocae TaxID=136492 RepID=UPI00146FA315|nr:NFACT RNA binding domain-containing protein [Atopobacter phocae]